MRPELPLLCFLFLLQYCFRQMMLWRMLMRRRLVRWHPLRIVRFGDMVFVSDYSLFVP